MKFLIATGIQSLVIIGAVFLGVLVNQSAGEAGPWLLLLLPILIFSMVGGIFAWTRGE